MNSKRRSFGDVDYDDRFNKKARLSTSDESIEDKLDELIVRIGEKSVSSIDRNIEDLANLFNFDVLPKNTRIVEVFCECVAEFPQKVCIYSTLIGLLNVRNYGFGGEVVEKLILDFRNYLKQGQFEKARILVRFFGDLVNTRVISSASLINLFENLVDVTMEDNIPQVRSDYFIYTVLSALPWVGKELYEKKEQELDQILNTIDNYISKRKKNEHLEALRVWHKDEPHPQEEYLDCLWAQIAKLRSDKWEDHHIYRPYLNFDTVLCEALQHNIPIIKPPPHESINFYPYPKIIFRLFDYTDCPERTILPGTHAIERFLVEDNLCCILNQNCFDRKDCASALLSYSNLSMPSKIPLEYVIIEVMFSQLFLLPNTLHPEICYGSIFLDLCKLQPSTFPQALAQAVELMFDRLDNMNGTCINRFASWFAYHLSNFQFRWGWDDWSISLKHENLHQKPKFIAETLGYCLRLSYHAKVLESIPQTFHRLAPKQPAPKNKFIVKSGNEEENNEENAMETDQAEVIGSNHASRMMTALTHKCSPDEALDILKEIDENDDMTSSLKIEIFITSLLNYASKSMTHCFASIAKYRPILKLMNVNNESQICILNTIQEVWSTHQQLIVVLCEKLMKSEVLQYSSVAIWIFSKANSDEFMEFYMWEILHSAIKRTVKNVDKCTKELEQAKDKQSKISDGDDDNNNNEETISYEMIEKLEEKLDSALNEQKNLFLIIFQRFIMILTEHIQSCEAQGKSFRNYWHFWALSRLQEIFFRYDQYIFKFNTTYETLLFTSDLDQNVLLVFKQFQSLRA